MAPLLVFQRFLREMMPCALLEHEVVAVYIVCSGNKGIVLRERIQEHVAVTGKTAPGPEPGGLCPGKFVAVTVQDQKFPLLGTQRFQQNFIDQAENVGRTREPPPVFS